MNRSDETKTGPEGIWYPGDLSPHLYYINGELRGMAAAIPRILGEIQKWEAFDMRQGGGSKSGPLLLGLHNDVDLAKRQIEQMTVGASR